MLRVHLVLLPTLAYAMAVTNPSTYTAATPSPVLPPVSAVPAAPVRPTPQPQQPQQPEPAQPTTPDKEEVQPENLLSLLDYIGYQPDEAAEPGFIVQNGFEGYIVPAGLPISSGDGPASLLKRLGLILGLIKLPKFMVAFFPLISAAFSNLLLLGLIGGALTTAVCALTPLCSITFLGLGAIRADNLKSQFTREKLNTAASFVLDSIDKYRELLGKKEPLASGRSAKRRPF